MLFRFIGTHGCMPMSWEITGAGYEVSTWWHEKNHACYNELLPVLAVAGWKPALWSARYECSVKGKIVCPRKARKARKNLKLGVTEAISICVTIERLVFHQNIFVPFVFFVDRLFLMCTGWWQELLPAGSRRYGMRDIDAVLRENRLSTKSTKVHEKIQSWSLRRQSPLAAAIDCLAFHQNIFVPFVFFVDYLVLSVRAGGLGCCRLEAGATVRAVGSSAKNVRFKFTRLSHRCGFMRACRINLPAYCALPIQRSAP